MLSLLERVLIKRENQHLKKENNLVGQNLRTNHSSRPMQESTISTLRIVQRKKVERGRGLGLYSNKKEK